jgi:DNA-binding protein H-NS
MTNLIDIQDQIEKLQKQAAVIKTREFNNTVEEIRSKMQAFGITLKDLQPGKTRGKARADKTLATTKRTAKAGKKKSLSTATVAPKFRGPNGETWSGRGLMPRWLSALVAQGRNKVEFAIQA